ncbi:hypothetical protein [Salinisphaera sp. S4-8]|uniref:hypothetical protein n=1 Tax=Salinisphaera sp. S4-8 TaxID=633357 RepID=UPI00334221AD
MGEWLLATLKPAMKTPNCWLVFCLYSRSLAFIRGQRVFCLRDDGLKNIRPQMNANTRKWKKCLPAHQVISRPQGPLKTQNTNTALCLFVFICVYSCLFVFIRGQTVLGFGDDPLKKIIRK